MALRVWLPLNGNLNNQGLSDLTITNIGATIDTSGKFGSCYLFDGTDDRIAFSSVSWTYPLSICGWFYPTNIDGTTTQYFISYNLDNSGTAGHVIGVGTLNNGKDLTVWAGGNCYTVGTTLVNDQWYHLSVTIDENKKYSFYLNGELKKTGTCSNNPGSNWITIGARSNSSSGSITSSSYYFKGKANDIRIYDECLSPKQVKEISKGLFAHYKLDDRYLEDTSNLVPENIYNYTSVPGAFYSGVRAIVQFEGETCFSVTTVQNSYGDGFICQQTAACTENEVYTYSGYIWIPIGYNWSIGMRQTTGGGGYFHQTIVGNGEWQYFYKTFTANSNTSGMIQGYEAQKYDTVHTVYLKKLQLEKKDHPTPFINGTRTSAGTTDVSGFLNNLNKNGSLIISDNTNRYSLSTNFSGENTNYLYCSKFDWLKSPFTFNCWVYQTSATTTSSGSSTTRQFIVSQGRDCGYAGFNLTANNGYASLYIGTATSGTYYQITDSTVSLLNGWHMITGTFDGATAKLYVDGVLKQSKSTAVEPSWDHANGFVIGKMAYLYTGTTSYFPFVGNISDVRIYATALSVDDILTLYKTSGIIDNIGNSYCYEFVEED